MAFAIMILVFLSSDNDPVAPATRLIDEGGILKLVRNCATIRTEKGSHLAWWQGSVLWSKSGQTLVFVSLSVQWRR